MTRGACRVCGADEDAPAHVPLDQSFIPRHPRGNFHAFEAPEEIEAGDRCNFCEDEDCTGGFSDGETCALAFDHGAIMPNGWIREVVAQEGDAGGWLIKPVPGQVVADFTDKAEAEQAAAAWNLGAWLTIEQMETLTEFLKKGGVDDLIAAAKRGES